MRYLSIKRIGSVDNVKVVDPDDSRYSTKKKIKLFGDVETIRYNGKEYFIYKSESTGIEFAMLVEAWVKEYVKMQERTLLGLEMFTRTVEGRFKSLEISREIVVSEIKDGVSIFIPSDIDKKMDIVVSLSYGWRYRFSKVVSSGMFMDTKIREDGILMKYSGI